MKRILLLPGLGDVHWVFLKLQSWLEKQGPEWAMPEISIWDIDNRPRTLEYLQFIPWVKPGQYLRLDHNKEKKIFDSLYTQQGSPDVIFNFQGYDAFIGTNGNMRNGVPYSKVLGGAAINYQYGPVLTADNYGKHTRALGPYFVLCFSAFGMFEHSWCKKLTPDVIKRMLEQLRLRFLTHHFIFTGSPWDMEYAMKCQAPPDRFLVGKTSLSQFFSLLQHSDGYIGWVGGNSILAQHLGVPTVCWWSKKYFPKHDRQGWETPHSKTKHLVLEVEDYLREKTVAKIERFLEVARG